MEHTGLHCCFWVTLGKFVHCSAFLTEGYFATNVEIISVLQLGELENYVRHTEYAKPTSQQWCWKF